VECASALLRNGIPYATSLLDGVEQWGDERGFGSVADLRGRLAVPWHVDAEEYTREGYVAALQTARRSYLHL
jgi:dihydroorotate dehydrogenase (fumarate)